MKPSYGKLSAVLLSALVAGSLGLQGLAYAITNGMPDGEGHPYVCMVVAFVDGSPVWRGSGTLISPRVVLTAGHVTDGADSMMVWFTSDLTNDPSYPFKGIQGTPYTHPNYMIGGSPTLRDWISHDVGIIVLRKAVRLGEYGELPSEGVVDTLPTKTWVEQVGYGSQSQTVGDHGPPYWDNPRVRMYAPAQLIACDYSWSDEFIKLTANAAQGKGGTSYGDSGGPVLLGGTRVVIGVTSWGVDYNCKSVAYAGRVDTPDVLDWIKSFV